MHECDASITTATPFTLQLLDQQVGDLLRHPLLHLRAVRHLLDHAGQLAQPHDACRLGT